MIELTATVLVPERITSMGKGRTFLHLLLKHFPRHVPERFGEAEPLTERFDPGNLDSVLRAWGHFSFIAERSNPPTLVFVLFCPVVSRNPRHSSISLLRFQSDQTDDAHRVSAFVCEAAEIFGADYAVAHILTRTELEDRLAVIRQRPAVWPQASGEWSVAYLRKRAEREGFASVLSHMRDGHNTVRLRKGIRDLSWVTVFGGPYLELFGRERVLTTPAAVVRELSNGAVALTLTEGLNDTNEAWESYKVDRDRCKAHLDSDAFLDASMPPDHVYRVPQFRFPEG